MTGAARFQRQGSWRRPGRIRHFLREGRGSAAVEFALIAPIFIGLLISVLETGIYFFAQNVLQAATVQSSRMFLTGQAQASSVTQAKFASDVCPYVQVLFTCNNVMIDVNNYASFSGANVSTPTLTFNAQGQVTNTWNYIPGAAGEIMVVRLMYQWPVITGPFAFIVPNLSNGTSLIMGVTAFKVEP
jgi:Flp pilus assembly protein TadG